MYMQKTKQNVVALEAGQKSVQRSALRDKTTWPVLNNLVIQRAEITPKQAVSEAYASGTANKDKDDPGLLVSTNYLKDWDHGNTAKDKWRNKPNRTLNGYELEHVSSDSMTYPTAIDLKYREVGAAGSWLVYHVGYGSPA